MKIIKSIFSKRTILYPVVVFAAGFLMAAIIPMLSHSVNPFNFGRFIGNLIGKAIVFALIAGLVVDWNRRKKAKQKLRQFS